MEIGRDLTQRWSGAWQNNRWSADIALALIVFAIEVAGTHFVGQNQPGYRGFDAVTIVLLAGGVASLVVRRQYPGRVLLFTNAITLIYLLLGYPKGPVFLTMIIAFFTAVMEGYRLLAWMVLAGEFVFFPWLPYFVGNESAPTPTGIIGLAGWLFVLATVAEIVHIRQQRLARAREEEAGRRAADERLRIARELHDVLGHNISLISVQAGVALHLIDRQPEQARIALSVIKDASKDTLRELRTVLDVLREVNEGPPRSPSPSLACLSDLLSRASKAGLQVQTEVAGDLEGLPASVDLAAFRIVQESLTNVIRHSGQDASSVHIIRKAQELTLRIENAVSNKTVNDGVGLGQGILGMQERAAALGGAVEAGPGPDGGFRVFARLPLYGSTLSAPRSEA